MKRGGIQPPYLCGGTVAPTSERMTDEQTAEHREHYIARGLIIPRAEDVPSSSKRTSDAKGRK